MKLPACNPTSSPASSSSPTSSMVTILGLGSLLSERSSRTTFPDLSNFRLGRVSNRYRRVFGHPASIFFQRGLANVKTKEFSSLSAEEFDFGSKDNNNNDDDKNNTGACNRGGFVCSVFEVPRAQVYSDETDSDGRIVATKPTGDFLEREEEFDIAEVPFVEFSEPNSDDDGSTAAATKLGTLCTRFTDQGYLERWGKQRFDEHYGTHGIDTIWGWETDSGLLPCRVYLRHCCLAAQSMGPNCYDSFLDETFLVDRTTTIRQYLEEQQPDLIETAIPPPGFEERYSG